MSPFLTGQFVFYLSIVLSLLLSLKSCISDGRIWGLACHVVPNYQTLCCPGDRVIVCYRSSWNLRHSGVFNDRFLNSVMWQFWTKHRPSPSTDMSGKSRRTPVQRDQLGRTLIPPVRGEISQGARSAFLPGTAALQCIHRHTYCRVEIMKITQTFFRLWLVVKLDGISLICFICRIFRFPFLYFSLSTWRLLSIFNRLFLWNPSDNSFNTHFPLF